MEIRKRRGGVRKLHVPDPITMAAQRAILHKLLHRLPAVISGIASPLKGAYTGYADAITISFPDERRRWLRAVLHQQRTQQATTIMQDQISGWRAYHRLIEDGAQKARE